MTQYCYAQWSSVFESTVCFHHDAVLLYPVKFCYWEHSMLSSWHSIVMSNEVLLLRTQYAFIVTQYCYAQWSNVTEKTVCFHHDTVLLCPMKHCYWEHSMLPSWHSIGMPNEALLLRTVCFHHDTVLVCPMKHGYWEQSMLSFWHNVVMPNEAVLLRAPYAFILTQYCYVLWSTSTESIVCFHHDTVFYAKWSSVTESTVCFHLDTILLCTMKHGYWEHSMHPSLLCPMKHCDWEHSMLSSWHRHGMPNEALFVASVCFHHDTVLLCPAKYFYWEHSILSLWHRHSIPNEALLLRAQYAFIMRSPVIPCEVLLLRAQYAFIMTQAWYA